jgi:hypothetical protein
VRFMAQFTIKWPNGAEVTFEGDVTFAELQEFLSGDTPPVLTIAGSGRSALASRTDEREGDSDDDRMPLNPAVVEARFQEVEARTDVERVAVMAHLAVDAGLPGIDQATAERLYRELALRMPGLWRATFSNAQTRGYVTNAGQGNWRPTSAGSNFARLGQRRPSPARRRSRPQAREAAET